MRPINTLPGS